MRRHLIIGRIDPEFPVRSSGWRIQLKKKNHYNLSKSREIIAEQQSFNSQYNKYLHQYVCGMIATESTAWESNPFGGEIFPTLPDGPWGPPSFLYIGHWVIPRGKTAGA